MNIPAGAVFEKNGLDIHADKLAKGQISWQKERTCTYVTFLLELYSLFCPDLTQPALKAKGADPTLGIMLTIARKERSGPTFVYLKSGKWANM